MVAAKAGKDHPGLPRRHDPRGAADLSSGFFWVEHSGIAISEFAHREPSSGSAGLSGGRADSRSCM
jgi:hypothetical protein